MFCSRNIDEIGGMVGERERELFKSVLLACRACMCSPISYTIYNICWLFLFVFMNDVCTTSGMPVRCAHTVMAGLLLTNGI